MEIDTTMRDLEELLKVQKPKKNEAENILKLLDVLLHDAGGRAALTDRIDRRLIRRSVVFDSVVGMAREIQARSPTEMDPSAILLLKATAARAQNDEAAKWIAFDLLLRRGEIGVRQEFAEALDGIKPKHELARFYAEWIRPHMADGGATWLAKLLDDCRNRGLKERLEPIVASLRGSDEEGRKERERAEDVSAAKRGDRPAGAGGQNAARLPDGVDAKLRRVKELLAAVAEECGARESKLAELSAELQDAARKIESFSAERNRQAHELQALEEERAGLQTTVDGLKQRAGELQKQAQSLADNLEKERARAKQDVAIAQGEARHAVQSFKHELWRTLNVHMIEAMDSTIHIEELPLEQQILLRRLRAVLESLRRCGVAPGA